MCAQCPFRRASCPGWTGPWTPTERLEAIRERPFPCHPTIAHDDQQIEDDTLQSCAGAAIFLNNSGETCYSGWTVRLPDPVDGLTLAGSHHDTSSDETFVPCQSSTIRAGRRCWSCRVGVPSRDGTAGLGRTV